MTLEASKRRFAFMVIFFLVSQLVSPLVGRASAQPAPRPLSVADLVAMADERNPSIAAARRTVEAADAAVNLARAGWGVTVTAQGTAGIGGGTSTSSSSFSSSAGLVGSYILYDSGQTGFAVRQAEANLRSARAVLDQVRQDTALAVAQAYMTLLRAQRAVEQRQQVVVQDQELLRLAEAQFQAGVVARSDVAQAQANLAAAEGDLIAASNDADLAVAALNTTLGQGPTTPIAAAAPTAAPPVTVASADLARLVEQRPEVRKALADIEAAEAGVALAQAGGGLQLALTGATTQAFAPTGQTTYSLGTTVSFPLADAGRNSAQVGQAQANLAAARARIEGTRLTVQQQAVSARFNIATARARITSAQAGLAYAQESLRLAQGRYATGVGRLLEVTTAQTALVQAQVSLDGAQFDELTAVISLRYALGRSVVDGAI